MTTESQNSTKQPNRREVLVKGVAGAVAVTSLTAFKNTAMAEEPTPGTTEGPYWVEEMLNRSDIRSDPSTGLQMPGLPLRLTISVSQLDETGKATPLSGAYVDIWHCNAEGLYSDEAAQNTLGQKYLRGYQITNAHGLVKFTTIYPGWYSGRTVHIHIRVRVYDQATDTVTYNQVTQVFFDDAITNQVYQLDPYVLRPLRDTLNAIDSIYNDDADDDGQADGDQLLLKLSAKQTYAIASYNFYLDLNDGNGNGDDQGDIGGGGPPPGDGGTPPGGGDFPPGGGDFPPGGGNFPPGGGDFPPGGGTPPAGA